jgi:glycosyltransferase involved in cell wall biosynthesis
MDETAMTNLRVLLIHDWLTGMRGGEKVLEVFCRRWPNATLYTLLHKAGSVSAAIERLHRRTSYLQWFPAVHRYYRYLLPLMPGAVNWRLPACDLVVSSSHCVAKGVTPPAGVPHICYCHTPMRYAWHMQESYFQQRAWRGLKGWLVDRLMARMREWDRRTAQGVTHFVANSHVVQQRILDCYGRASVVIHPPVNTDYFFPAPAPREDFYLALSAFAPYKRLDLAIEACNRLRRRLIVIGSGQDEKRLRGLAGPTVRFLGWQADDAIRDHLRRARALLFPGEEDFGIVPVEAQACGTPVIAFGKGGALDTVRGLGLADRPTGMLFEDQSVDCLAETLERFERERDIFRTEVLRRHALQFSAARFAREMFGYVNQVMTTRGYSRRAA